MIFLLSFEKKYQIKFKFKCVSHWTWKEKKEEQISGQYQVQDFYFVKWIEFWELL